MRQYVLNIGSWAKSEFATRVQVSGRTHCHCTALSTHVYSVISRIKTNKICKRHEPDLGCSFTLNTEALTRL